MWMLMTVKNDMRGMDWGAAGNARIAQNVLNLINTYRYEVAYNRTMGIDPALIDRPSPAAIAQLKVDIADLVARYEPRATLKTIHCAVSDSGNIETEVVIEV